MHRTKIKKYFEKLPEHLKTISLLDTVERKKRLIYLITKFQQVLSVLGKVLKWWECVETCI